MSSVCCLSRPIRGELVAVPWSIRTDDAASAAVAPDGSGHSLSTAEGPKEGPYLYLKPTDHKVVPYPPLRNPLEKEEKDFFFISIGIYGTMEVVSRSVFGVLQTPMVIGVTMTIGQHKHIWDNGGCVFPHESTGRSCWQSYRTWLEEKVCHSLQYCYVHCSSIGRHLNMFKWQMYHMLCCSFNLQVEGPGPVFTKSTDIWSVCLLDHSGRRSS